MTSRPPARATDGRPPAPVRILHLGIGNFARAHQAWYTDHAPDADQWGIAAFTGRSSAVADQLRASQGIYQLCVAAPEGDRVEVISALSAIHPGDALEAWRGYFERPEVAIVTTTITEAGYRRGPDGDLDLDDPQVRADLEALRADRCAPVLTAPGRLVAGLMARRAAAVGDGADHHWGLSLCPCDNIPDNGAMVRRVLTTAAALVDPALPPWIEEHCGFITTMVDRITPRTTAEDRARVRAATGIEDPALVVTEPFAEWVLNGDFVAGHPRWEEAGARFVEDVSVHEDRKLTMLNGSHSLMAYAGPILGLETVSEAISDPRLRHWVEEFWQDACTHHLSLPREELDAYRAALVERFENPRIRHLLAQIAADGSQKVAIRHVPTIRDAAARGQVATGATRGVAAWILHLRGLGAPVNDVHAEQLRSLVSGDETSAAMAVLDHLGINTPAVLETVLAQMAELRT